METKNRTQSLKYVRQVLQLGTSSPAPGVIGFGNGLEQKPVTSEALRLRFHLRLQNRMFACEKAYGFVASLLGVSEAYPIGTDGEISVYTDHVSHHISQGKDLIG